MVRGEIMEKSLINPLKEAHKEYQELIGKYGKLYSENCCLKLSILEIKEENERLKQELLTYKNSICNKECAEVWGESERLKEENEQLKQQLTKGRDILFEFVKIACETFSEGCPECDYCFLGEVKQKAEVFFKELAE